MQAIVPTARCLHYTPHMTKRNRARFTFLLASLTAASLAACGGDQGPKSQTTTRTTVDSVNQDGTAAKSDTVTTETENADGSTTLDKSIDTTQTTPPATTTP